MLVIQLLVVQPLNNKTKRLESPKILVYSKKSIQKQTFRNLFKDKSKGFQLMNNSKMRWTLNNFPRKQIIMLIVLLKNKISNSII